MFHASHGKAERDGARDSPADGGDATFMDANHPYKSTEEEDG